MKKYSKKKKYINKKRRGNRRVARGTTGRRKRTNIKKVVKQTIKSMADTKAKFVRREEDALLSAEGSRSVAGDNEEFNSIITGGGVIL